MLVTGIQRVIFRMIKSFIEIINETLIKNVYFLTVVVEKHLLYNYQSDPETLPLK